MLESDNTQTKPIQTTIYILLSISIGLAVIGYLFRKEFDPRIFSEATFSAKTVACIFAAVLLMLGRDLGLIWRYRKISGNLLSWKQAIRVNILCEFTSAVTPSAVGGSSLIVIFLNKEGINAGSSTAMMFACLFLDELFFVISIPIILIGISIPELFGTTTVLSQGIMNLFFLVYTLITIWTLVLYIGLFRKPEWIGRILTKLSTLKILKRWKRQISELGDNLVTSSHTIGKKPFRFWLSAFGATAFSWISRYLVVNALLLAFSPVIGKQLLAFARQFILWIVMIVSPTPGGSGFSEYMFREYYADFFPMAGMVLVTAFVWRLITYYLYLTIGICVIPGWIKKNKATIKEKV